MVLIRYFRGPILRRKLALVAAIGLILGVGAGAAVYARFAHAAVSGQAPSVLGVATNSGCDTGPRPAIGNYPADSNGDGVISDEGNERIPALIAAVASNGVAGYVKYTDLFCQAAPASPAAALAGQGSEGSIPVYASDGTTIVGKVTVGGPSVAFPVGGTGNSG